MFLLLHSLDFTLAPVYLHCEAVDLNINLGHCKTVLLFLRCKKHPSQEGFFPESFKYKRIDNTVKFCCLCLKNTWKLCKVQQIHVSEIIIFCHNWHVQKILSDHGISKWKAWC